MANFFTKQASKCRKRKILSNIIEYEENIDLKRQSQVMYKWLTHNNMINDIIENFMDEIVAHKFETM